MKLCRSLVVPIFSLASRGALTTSCGHEASEGRRVIKRRRAKVSTVTSCGLSRVESLMLSPRSANWACPRGVKGRDGRASCLTALRGRRGQSGHRCLCSLVSIGGSGVSRVCVGGHVLRSGTLSEICTKVSTSPCASGRQVLRSARPFFRGLVCRGSFSTSRRKAESGSCGVTSSRGRCFSTGITAPLTKHGEGITRL